MAAGSNRNLRRYARLGLAVIAPLILASVEATATDDGPRASSTRPIDLDLYASLLATHTREVTDLVGTRVDYRAIARSDDWKKLGAQVRAARPSRLTPEAALAYWINAYNILTIELIANNYPVESIRDLGSFFSPVWNRAVATIESRARSLGAIEHEILRKMGEPRIHAAIVCASTSCPPLAREPFRPDTLDADLDRAMARFLASDRKGIAIDRATRTVTVSKIFDWFEDDFDATGGVLTSIARHVKREDADWLRENGDRARLRYFEYDWTLNDLR